MLSLMIPSACPRCVKEIDRNLIKVSKEFPCPKCGQLVRTSRAFRIWMSVIPIGLATYATWRSSVPFGFKFIEWPFFWFIFTGVYIWLFSIARPPTLVAFQKKNDDEEVQRLGLS